MKHMRVYISYLLDNTKIFYVFGWRDPASEKGSDLRISLRNNGAVRRRTLVHGNARISNLMCVCPWPELCRCRRSQSDGQRRPHGLFVRPRREARHISWLRSCGFLVANWNAGQRALRKEITNQLHSSSTVKAFANAAFRQITRRDIIVVYVTVTAESPKSVPSCHHVT